MGFVANNGFGGRTPLKTDEAFILELRKAASEKVEALWGAYLDALEHPDQEIRMRGADRIADRLFGRPVTRGEVSVDGTVTLSELFVETPAVTQRDALPADWHEADDA